MQLCGIICEFNPFHNGHKYLIEQAKKLTKSSVVCLMSGNFVQRGDPAFQDKYERAKNAITCGADVVLSQPPHLVLWQCFVGVYQIFEITVTSGTERIEIINLVVSLANDR